MGGVLRRIGDWATRIESWLSLAGYIAMTGFFGWLGSQWSMLVDQGWAAVVIFAVLSACLVVGALSGAFLAFARLRGPAVKSVFQENGELTPVYGGRYKNETVNLDGHKFISCTFENVTFKYNGGNFDFVDCTISDFGFTSDINGIVRAVDFVAQILRFERTEVIDGRGKSRISFNPPKGSTQVLSDEPQSLLDIEQKTQP